MRTHQYPETTFFRYADGTALMTRVSSRKRMVVFVPEGGTGIVIRAIALHPSGSLVGPGSVVVTTRFGLNLVITDFALSHESADALFFLLGTCGDKDWERMQMPCRISLETRVIFDSITPDNHHETSSFGAGSVKLPIKPVGFFQPKPTTQMHAQELAHEIFNTHDEIGQRAFVRDFLHELKVLRETRAKAMIIEVQQLNTDIEALMQSLLNAPPKEEPAKVGIETP